MIVLPVIFVITISGCVIYFILSQSSSNSEEKEERELKEVVYSISKPQSADDYDNIEKGKKTDSLPSYNQLYKNSLPPSYELAIENEKGKVATLF